MRSFTLSLAAALAACVPAVEPGFAPPPDLVFYSDGQWGTFEFDNGTFPMGASVCTSTGISNVATPDSLTGGSPSLQVTTSITTLDLRIVTTSNTNAVGTLDLAPYKLCHLEFDAKLLAADATSVVVSANNPSACSLPFTHQVEILGQLSTTEFTRITIPLTPDLYGAAGPQSAGRQVELLRIKATLPSASGNRPVLLLNNVRWTGF